MINKKVVPIHFQGIEIINGIKLGRKNIMSVLNLNLNISCLDINIKIQRNEEKQKEKIRKIIEQNGRMNDEFNRRSNQEYDHMLYHMIKHQ